MVRVDSESGTTHTASTSKVRKTHSDSTPSSDAANLEGKEATTEYVRTYRLIPGTICTESRAVQCALEFGIRRDVLRRAMNIKANVTAAPRTGEEENKTGMPKNMVVVPLFNTYMKHVWTRIKPWTRKKNSTTNTTSRAYTQTLCLRFNENNVTRRIAISVERMSLI